MHSNSCDCQTNQAITRVHSTFWGSVRLAPKNRRVWICDHAQESKYERGLCFDGRSKEQKTLYFDRRSRFLHRHLRRVPLLFSLFFIVSLDCKALPVSLSNTDSSMPKINLSKYYLCHCEYRFTSLIVDATINISPYVYYARICRRCNKKSLLKGRGIDVTAYSSLQLSYIYGRS